MAYITINLSDEQLKKLQQLAQKNGVTAEDLLRSSVEDWLNHPKSDFAQASSYVLQKNAELYRRLA